MRAMSSRLPIIGWTIALENQSCRMDRQARMAFALLFGGRENQWD